MGESYILALNDLKSGVSAWSWDVFEEFFRSFDNEIISSADLRVSGKAAKTGASVEVDLDIEGEVTLPCDRCLEDVVMDIDTKARLKVRYGAPSAEDDEEDGREVVWIPAGECELDLAQVIYDYVLLDLPLKCCHRDGECNPEVVRHLSEEEGCETVASDEPAAENPFAALKNMFDK